MIVGLGTLIDSARSKSAWPRRVINPRDIQGCPFNDSLRASLRNTSTPAACKACAPPWKNSRPEMACLQP